MRPFPHPIAGQDIFGGANDFASSTFRASNDAIMELRRYNMELQQQIQLVQQERQVERQQLAAILQANYEQIVRLTERANAQGGDSIPMPPPLVIPPYPPPPARDPPPEDHT